MNYAVIGRLMWKEYRTQRAFWWVMAGFTLATQILLRLQFSDFRGPDMLFYSLVPPMLYAIGCGACLFAQEKDEGTFELLRILPTAPGGLLAGKFSFGLGSVLAQSVLAWITFLVILWLPESNPESARKTFGCFGYFGWLVRSLTAVPLPMLVQISCCNDSATMVFGGTILMATVVLPVSGGTPLSVASTSRI